MIDQVHADAERLPEPAAPERPRALSRARAVYWLYAGHLVTVFGLALSNILLALTVLALPWSGASPRAAWRRGRPLLIALAAYVALYAIAIAASLDPVASLGTFGEPFNLLALPLALLLVHGERDTRRIVHGLIGLGAGSGLLGLGQFLVGYGDMQHRIRASFSHYMTFSGVLLVADLLLLAQLAAGRGRGLRGAWRWGALVVINAALFGSFTRSAWVGLAVAVTLLVALRSPRWLLALPVVALLFVAVAPQPIVDRAISIADLDDPSNLDRLSMANAGMRMIADHPLTGLGPEMVDHAYPRYRVEWAVRDEVPHLHNAFLEIAAERGLPALAAFLALIGLAAAAAWRGFRREGGFAGPRADLWVGALTALVAFNVAGLFEDNWGDTEVQRLALFLIALPFCLGAGRPVEEAPAAGDSLGPAER